VRPGAHLPSLLTSIHSGQDSFDRLPGCSLRLRGWLFPLTSPGPVVGPSRFPQSRPCGVLWSARNPCQHHPTSIDFPQDLTAPPALSLAGAASELTLPRILTSIHSGQESFDRLPRLLPPLARLALSTHVSWTGRWPVSLSSVETLRRALVCTLPLSAQSDFHRISSGSDSTPELVAARRGIGAFASKPPDLHPLGSEHPSTDFPGSSLRLRGWHFPLTFPGPVVGPSRFPQSRPCGVLWSARSP